jgi:hypothetical protein
MVHLTGPSAKLTESGGPRAVHADPLWGDEPGVTSLSGSRISTKDPEVGACRASL